MLIFCPYCLWMKFQLHCTVYNTFHLQSVLFILPAISPFSSFTSIRSINMTYLPLFIYHVLWPFMSLSLHIMLSLYVTLSPISYLTNFYSLFNCKLKMSCFLFAMKLSAVTSYVVSAFISSIRFFVLHILNI